MPDRPGVAFQILGAIADANIEVDMIIQNQSVGGKTDFTFTVPRPDYNRAMDLLNHKVKAEVGATDIIGDAKVSKVSAIGIGMRSHVGVASKMFETLFEEVFELSRELDDTSLFLTADGMSCDLSFKSSI